jgi:CRISPR-associated endonuclease/helicase Cas3
MGAYANGAFIFDEIHAYDAKMWRALLAFIQLDVPCLLMTASLQAERIVQIEQALDQVGETLGRPLSRSDREKKEIYTLVSPQPQDISVAWKCALEVVANNGRVLWVTNTVDKCINLYEEAVHGNIQALCYHSRFKVEDRSQSHKTVVNSFKRDSNWSGIAFTTQVAEMSLDINCDLLVTDLAPIPSLIQRLGRLNRHLSDILGEWIVIEASCLPYTEEEMAEAIIWLSKLPAENLSQDHLLDTWRIMGMRDDVFDEQPLNHLDGLWETRRGSLRQTDGINIDIILPEDEEAVIAETLKIHQARLRVHIYKDVTSIWKRWPNRYEFVPPSGTFHYTKERGAKWLKKL